MFDALSAGGGFDNGGLAIPEEQFILDAFSYWRTTCTPAAFISSTNVG